MQVSALKDEKEKVKQSQSRKVTPPLDTHIGCRVGGVTLVVLVLLEMDPKRHQLLSQRRLGLKNQRSLTTKDPKRFGYLNLLDFFFFLGSKKEKWFLDSGCSRHMTGDESKFAFLTRRK